MHRYVSTRRHSASVSALALLAGLAGTGPALAEDASREAPLTIVVSPLRLAVAPETVGSSVTVVPGSAIEDAGKPTVFDALQTVPGLSLSRNGGPGGTSFARIRGAEPGQTQVMIDGVLLNDPAAMDGAFNFDALVPTALDRIEVLRGPQSALYGNDAMGGVVSIVTRRGVGGPTVTGQAEAGSYDTFRQSAGVSGGSERMGYALSGTNLVTGGFSRLADTAERDGTRSRGVTGKADLDVTPAWTVGVAAGLFDLRSDYDASSRDAPYHSKKTLRYGKIDNTLRLFGGRLENILTLSGSDTARSFDEPGGYIPRSHYQGTRVTGEYRANIHVDRTDVLTLGALRSRDGARIVDDNGRTSAVDTDATVTTTAFYGQYLLGLWDSLYLTLGGRHDRNDRFGTKNTVRATAAYQVAGTGTTLRGSLGTAGKAPTLYNLYAPTYGNPNLRPESSVGADAGIEQALWGGALTGSLTGFWNRFSDLITFDGATSTYRNVDRARTQGVEAALTWRPDRDLTLAATYTYTDSRNETTGRVLPRRPRHQASLSADWRATDALDVGGLVRFVGPQADSTYNTAVNAAFTVVDARASYALTDAVSVYGRVENLFNADYQEVARYATPGRSGYLGVKAKF